MTESRPLGWDVTKHFPRAAWAAARGVSPPGSCLLGTATARCCWLLGGSLGLPSPGLREGSEASRKAGCTGRPCLPTWGSVGQALGAGRGGGGAAGYLLPAHLLPAQLEPV